MPGPVPAGRSGAARCLPLLASVLLGAARLAAQGPPLPPAALPAGFAGRVSCAEVIAPTFVRGVLRVTARSHLIALRGDIFVVGPARAPLHPLLGRPVLSLPGDDVAFLVQGAPGEVCAAGLLSGQVTVLEAITGAVLGTFQGVANAFDAVALPGGDLLATANPTWPAAGANTGVWLLGPGRLPREILRLIGPSGPLLLLANGDLVVAELGPIVPPPPGTARLHRVPAARILAALAGATLTMADVTATAAGYDGIFGLAADHDGCIYSTNPSTGRVTRTLPHDLHPAGIWADLGPQRFASRLQFAAGDGGAFRPYQPRERAPALLVATSDFSTWFELVELAPERPDLLAMPAAILPPGPAAIALAGGPPGGLVVWLASTQPGGPERIALTVGGVPLWLGLPTSSAIALGGDLLDAQGWASFPFLQPGGIATRIDCQAIAFTPAGAPGSTPLLALHWLP